MIKGAFRRDAEKNPRGRGCYPDLLLVLMAVFEQISMTAPDPSLLCVAVRFAADISGGSYGFTIRHRTAALDSGAGEFCGGRRRSAKGAGADGMERGGSLSARGARDAFSKEERAAGAVSQREEPVQGQHADSWGRAGHFPVVWSEGSAADARVRALEDVAVKIGGAGRGRTDTAAVQAAGLPGGGGFP